MLRIAIVLYFSFQVFAEQTCRVLWSLDDINNRSIMICENVQELEITNMIFNLSNSSINSNISQSFLNITNNITTIVPNPSNITQQLNNSNISGMPSLNTTELSPAPSLNTTERSPATVPSPTERLPATAPSPTTKDISTPSPNIRGIIMRSSPSSINMENDMNATKHENNTSTTKDSVNTGIIIWSTMGIVIALFLSSIIIKIKRKSGGVHPCPSQKGSGKKYKLRDPNSIKRPRDYLIEHMNGKKYSKV